MDKLAVYKEKTQAIKKKIKTALTYPISIVVVAVVLIFVMMRWVLPAFKEVYSNMGAELPGMTQAVMNISDFFVEYSWIMIIAAIGMAFQRKRLRDPPKRRLHHLHPLPQRPRQVHHHEARLQQYKSC